MSKLEETFSISEVFKYSTFGYDVLHYIHDGLFTNGWETRSHDVWKLVSNRTLGIISKSTLDASYI